VHHPSGTRIKDIETVDSGWERTHWKTLVFNYSRAPYFERLAPRLHEIYKIRWRNLAEISETLIRLVLEYLDLRPVIYRASELEVEGKSSELLVDICRAVGDWEYLSGTGAKDYLDLAVFEREGISVKFQRFSSPMYPQLFGEFIPDLSAIDYLFNCGNQKWWLQGEVSPAT
jgi:hypothetical protein